MTETNINVTLKEDKDIHVTIQGSATVTDIAIDTNLSANAQDAISKRHSQNTDTGLGVLGTKDTPVDADKVIQRDSASSDALVTSTWTQVKSFLKTYFDTIYAAITHASKHTNGTDDIQNATASQKGLATATQITKLDGIQASAVALATVKGDTDIADAISKKHTRSHALDSTSDHSVGSLSNTYLVKSDGSKLVNATNTDSQVSGAVTASHARSHAIDSTNDHSAGGLTTSYYPYWNGTKLANGFLLYTSHSVVSGGLNGVTVTHNLGATTYTVKVMSKDITTFGMLGEVSVVRSNNSVVIYNTGIAGISLSVEIIRTVA